MIQKMNFLEKKAIEKQLGRLVTISEIETGKEIIIPALIRNGKTKVYITQGPTGRIKYLTIEKSSKKTVLFDQDEIVIMLE